GLAGVPWISRLPLVSTMLGNPLVDKVVARIPRICEGELVVLSKETSTCGGVAVAGVPADASLMTKVVVTPPCVTSMVSPLVKVGGLGAEPKVSVLPTVIGVVPPVLRL